jgi:hypothetical protein|tara:strand:+ start:178 stop:1548 length:1371 start_codon:yes stop_codon:yes gene_type:complete
MELKKRIRESIKQLMTEEDTGMGSQSVKVTPCRYGPYVGPSVNQFGDTVGYPPGVGFISTHGTNQFGLAFSIDGVGPQVGDQFIYSVQPWPNLVNAYGDHGPICVEVIEINGVASLDPNKNYPSCTCPSAPSKFDKPTITRKKIKEELNRLEDMDYHNTPDMEKDISRDEIENFDDTIGQVEFQDELVTLSSSERAQLRDMLEDVMDDKRKLEEAFDYKGIPELKAQGVFGKMFKWLKRYLTDKATTYLINASAEETKDTIELIKVMDPNDMTGIFDPKAIYLGGAIDFAKDALGWRTAMERYFGENHVVKDERMAKLVLTGEWDTKGISEPAILNPMRAETVREEDEEFTDLFGKWKKDSLTDDEMQSFREKIRQNIILQDLRMLDICDTNLLRYDGKAGAGTLGEAQISALKNQQIFLWVTDGMKISNVSPWLLPAVTKICIDDEIWELLKHFK